MRLSEKNDQAKSSKCHQAILPANIDILDELQSERLS
jgi:hypothetical protein